MTATVSKTILVHRRFICVESGFGELGHNKFWYVTKFSDNTVKCEWGRVDVTKSEKDFSFGSSEEADKFIAGKIKDKLKGKKGEEPYTEKNVISTVSATSQKLTGAQLEAEAIGQIANGDKKVEQLVKYLIKQNIHNITSNTNVKYDEASGLFTTPLGIVGQKDIDDARSVLTDLSAFVDKEDFENTKISKLLDRYMTLVPQGVGMNRPSLRYLCSSPSDVQKQFDILTSLQASLDFVLKNPDSKKEEKAKVWDIHLAEIVDSGEISRIKRKYDSNMSRSHQCSHLKIKTVYSVEIRHMRKAYDEHGAKLGNVMELWHGTRAGNILSIFSKGLIIPPSNASHVCGRMFGNGVYFSDQSTKSLNYSYGYWSGGGSRDNNCFMFLADVAMGKHHTPPSSNNGPPSGYDSTYAIGGRSGVANNEMIVYKTSQCSIKRLVEFAA